MPAMPPSKEEWIKDDDVNECMVCTLSKFTLLNRRHHCRRCGRVVCSSCSQKLTQIDNTPRRTCDDCYRQIEMLKKINENSRLNDSLLGENLSDSTFLGAGLRRKSQTNLANRAATQIIDNTSSTNNSDELTECANWQLMGGGEESESSQRRDDEVRALFKYQQAPSTSLCLSILDLNDNPLECGKDLLSMCDDLSSYLQAANSQVEDVGLIINMIKHLLHNAKVKLLQNSSTNMISLCDSYLSLIDVLEELLLANCSIIPSLNELRNTESVRRIRNRLLEEERHDLAMNLSTKCGLDTQTVWASWGLIELRRGNYKEARTKFEKCLKPVNDHSVSISAAQSKIINDIISYLENAPPIRMIGVSLSRKTNA
jgi:zinc finger FYVE domain-containing protein 26